MTFYKIFLTVKTSKNAGGSSSSIDPMSLENLFRILPIGKERIYLFLKNHSVLAYRVGIKEATRSTDDALKHRIMKVYGRPHA